MIAADFFPILVSSYRFEEMARSARQEGATTIIIQVPWAMLAPHEAQAKKNHGGQTLQRLAQRGGLSAAEAVAVLEDRPFSSMSFGASHERLATIHLEWLFHHDTEDEATPPPPLTREVGS